MKEQMTDEETKTIDYIGSSAWWDEQLAKREEQKQKSKTEILAILELLGADEIEAEFSGSGDSGLIENAVISKDNKPLAIADTPDLRKLLEIEKDEQEIPADAVEEYINERLYAFLPGGWEINNGSYGEIHVKPSGIKVDFNYYPETEHEEIEI
jgi:hypothetical protein